MSAPIADKGLPLRFWEKKSLAQMNDAEWEALCDGCGKCCLNKLEDEDSGEVALTRVACRLLDDASCRCAHYDNRHQFVPDCIVLKPSNIESHLYWMPQTCAYRLLHEGKPLAEWHPLVSGSPETVHEAGVSMRDQTVSEYDVADDDWEDHIIEEPT
ncbi:MAG: YcgN family cysteine cluster protein [Tateyamaria sp.]|uniref:YcgN family cysteine cluster protein n=1 Tax=Tateyamaria sp. TaxID=1929288 RepID=UPI003294EBB9